MIKIQYIIFKYTILKYLHAYPIIYFLISIIIFLWYSVHFGDVYLCDDGTGRSSEWVSEWNSNDSGNRGKDNNYQPYRPGLQPTSQGYRYEADSKEVNYQYTSQGYRYEAGGRPVNTHPYSYDSTRNTRVDQMYSGNMNPSGGLSERGSVIPGDSISSQTAIKHVKNIYSNPLPEGKNMYIKHDSLAKTLWGHIKNDFKSSRDSALRDHNKSLEDGSKIMSNIRDTRVQSDIIKQVQRNTVNSRIPKVVRRFD